MKRRMTVLLALVAAVGLGAYTIAALLFSGPRGVTLVFQAVAQGDHLIFNDARYDNPRGAGELEINAFRFFVSNLRLEGEEKTYLVPDSYHIVRFDGPDEAFRIHLPETELNRIEPVYLSLGIDETRNTSLDVIGDLDPNNRMAWNWEVDYKFVLLEGAMMNEAERLPVV